MPVMSASSPAFAPTILAIETSTELASVALLHRGQLASRESSGAQTHSMSVPAMVQALLADAGLKVAQCDALAYGMGPGSFTGVRTACGLAQGLAYGASLRVAPVVTLMAMAESVRQSMAGDAGNQVLAVLDARMGEVYWAQYRYDGRWQCVSEPALSATSAVVAVGTPVVCGNGLSAYPEGFAQLADLQRLPAIMPHANAVAMLATDRVQENTLLAARDAQPLYLRNKVALTTAERIAAAAPASTSPGAAATATTTTGTSA
jgi:tRNA threonylcarbamoyladenosine biosynthesis protein TsaB